MPIPRFRIRTLMIAVAVVAGSLVSIPRAYEHNRQCMQKAAFYGMRHGQGVAARQAAGGRLLDKADDAGVEWFEFMERKYRRAAWMPWLLLWPDPPDPWPDPPPAPSWLPMPPDLPPP